MGGQSLTYSIVARDSDTGHLGVAVASRFFAVGALVPHVRGGRCAVATQAFVSPIWGIEAADRIAAGEGAEAVLADLVTRDEGEAMRQIHAVDTAGSVAAHTGSECIDWCGHVSAPGVSVAGNMLSGQAVVADTLAAFLDNMDQPLAERLMTAMEAGAAAGGDKRGTQSATLVVHRSEDYPWLSLRADDHPGPLEELRRLYDVANERFIHFADALPTRANFSGATDRTPVDAAIRAEEDRRRATGQKSRSFATTLEGEDF